VAQGAKLPIRAVLTDMSQPLAPCAGNACEVQFAVDYLKGVMKAPRFHAVMLALCAHMLVLGKLVESLEEGHRKALAALESGRAAEVFARMVAGLGGPKDFMQRSKSYLNQAHVIRPVLPQQTGQIIGIETRQIGLAVIGLGGGRTRVDDMINPVVGLTHLKQIGEWCDPDTPLAFIHASSDHAYEIASQQVRDAFIVSEHDLRPYDPARDVSNILEIIGDAS
jgi:thymidine phosphorylase